MDLSALKALPIGLILFCGLVWGYWRRRAGHRRARETYPALAQHFGLAFRAPRSPNCVGQLHGVQRGFRVLVDPDDQRKVIVRFNGEPAVDLRNYETPRQSGRLAPYTSLNRVVDTYLKTRLASTEIAERLSAADLPKLLLPFTERYRYETKQLNVTQHGVTCVLDFGNPPHIPASAVRDLLPALLDLAELIEPRDDLGRPSPSGSESPSPEILP